MRAQQIHKAYKKIPLYLVLTLLLIVSVFPFIFMVLISFQTITELFGYPPKLIPSSLSLENYKAVFRALPFARQFFNSVFVAVSVTLAQLLFSSLTGYTLAKLRFPGRSVFFALILATMMIPYTARLIPTFLVIVQFGWINTYQALIMPGIMSAFGIFLMRQFMLSIPDDLINAARIDGASEFRIYAQVILPSAKPILATLAILTFNWSWSDFMWPLVVTSKMEMRTLTVGLSILQGEHVSDWNVILAAATMVFVPVLIIFCFLQKYYVRGIALTGIR